MNDVVRLSAREVHDLAMKALIAAGAGQDAADSVARAVVAAESEGIKSHGLAYVPTYWEHLRCGKVAPGAEPTVKRPAPATLRVDAGSGFAHPAIEAGFEELKPTANEQGIGALSVHNSYNCGVLGYHVSQLSRDGFLGIGFTNAPASIAPPGGTRAVIGTNPVAVAVPGSEGEPEILIDQSASVVAKSELIMRARAGEPIPTGWALDAKGRETTDPAEGLKGTMTPVGGYKGFGIGLFVEVMAAGLAGANLGLEASPFSGSEGGPPGTGQFFIAISPTAFSGPQFEGAISRLRSAIEQEGGHVPGAGRREAARRSEQQGIEVSRSVVQTLSKLAECRV